MNRLKSCWKTLFPYLRIVIVAFIAALLITSFILCNVTVPSGSMIPTMQIGDRVMGFRFSYWFSDPARGDIIAFWAPDEEHTRYTKRVIGLPGETVELRAGKLYVNGALNDAFSQFDAITYGDWGPYDIPEGCYFIMGDNRNNSLDSRFWRNTFVPREAIISKLHFRYWPKVGLIK